MELKHYFLAYFCWIIFNKTTICEKLNKAIKEKLISAENKWGAVFLIRYPLTICAACFSFWCNLLPSLFYGSIFDNFMFFCLVFGIESLTNRHKNN